MAEKNKESKKEITKQIRTKKPKLESAEKKPEKIKEQEKEKIPEKEKEPEEIIKEEKIEVKKAEIEKLRKKEAVVNGRNLGISDKQSVAVCNFIRNKNIDNAINSLELVGRLKLAIPMKGEIPHRKGIMSGRYPVKTTKEFSRLLKSLRANAIFNEIDIDKVKISCMANIAQRPYKRFGQRRSKRSHVQIKLIPIKNNGL